MFSLQKLQEWRAALGKMTFEDEKYGDMAKYPQVRHDVREDDIQEVIYTKSLPWQSKKFNELVAHLDIQTASEMKKVCQWEGYCCQIRFETGLGCLQGREWSS